MMRAVVGAFVLAVGIGTAMAAPLKKKDVVFVGTVLQIQQVNADDMIHNFVVHVSVDEVLSGPFSNATFSFAVHSPARAGLEVGVSYKITARWTGDGYRVREHEVRRQKNSPPDAPK